ncbi:MAG: pyridoxal-phosphate dependent enzyme [Bacteroidales bacterium]|nr:pyridoxal-phosphate dependent enzyme [Bacteroidales bacterium]
MSAKYRLICTQCGHDCGTFDQWFAGGQKCPKCGCARAEAEYSAPIPAPQKASTDSFLQKYFDILPLESRENIVSMGEGCVPIERYESLEKWALEECGVNCEIHLVRNDLSGGTGSFKDPAAAMGASLLKEHKAKRYCIASTGNSATAFACYLAKAGVACTVFTPKDASPDSIAQIRAYGQECVVVDGNYGAAKAAAANAAAENGWLICGGNTDPIRIEGKRTFVYELLEHFDGRMPDYYFQAVAGGTMPIALDKGARELASKGVKVDLPRIMLVQQDLCDPMVQAWEKAVKTGFPEGWEKDYPSIEPQTKISILSAGTPGMYPIVAPIVRKSGGTFIRIKESEVVPQGREIWRSSGIEFGPASIVCIMGLIKALRDGLIENGSKVLLNPGEGCSRNTAFKQEMTK